MKLKYLSYFEHPSLGTCLVLEPINGETTKAFVFEVGVTKTFVTDFIIDKCSESLSAVPISKIIKSKAYEALYDSKTKSRAFEYINHSKIDITSSTNFAVEAKIKGTFEYKVKIESTRSGLKINCDCPVDSLTCKHSYALFAFLKEKIENEEGTNNNSYLQKLIHEAKKTDIGYFKIAKDIYNYSVNHVEESLPIITRELRTYDYQYNFGLTPIILLAKETFYPIIPLDVKSRFTYIYNLYKNAKPSNSRAVKFALINAYFEGNFEYINAYLSQFYYAGSNLLLDVIVEMLDTIELTSENIYAISSIGFNKEQKNKIFEHIRNSDFRKIYYLLNVNDFSGLKEFKDVKVECEDIYNLFNASKLSSTRLKLINDNYKEFIKSNKGDYLFAMCLELLDDNPDYFTHRTISSIIDELPKSSFLCYIGFNRRLTSINDLDGEEDS